LTVTEIFKVADLSLHGPVQWGTDIAEPKAGVYVVARVSNPNVGCKACALPFIDPPLPPDIELDIEYERRRWLPSESIVYIGKTDRTIHKRLQEFRRHKCGDLSPHAGGQVVKLLQSDLWVYWSPTDTPYDSELTMICAFKSQTGQLPFANELAKRSKKRVRRSS
jgi:hypothetical protein